MCRAVVESALGDGFADRNDRTLLFSQSVCTVCHNYDSELYWYDLFSRLLDRRQDVAGIVFRRSVPDHSWTLTAARV